MTTIAAALAAARCKLPASEARLLLGHVLQRPASWLLAHDDAALGEEDLTRFASLCARRRGGEPVPYLTGLREFYGREFLVGPGVLIPRPETELLVDLALQIVGAGGTAPRPFRVLDLGTGSGCIAISIALACAACDVTALDRSPAALGVAARNAEHLGARVRMIESDWFDALRGERFDLILANPPYIASDDPHLGQGDLRHEPVSALASGSDGLDSLRRIIAQARGFLHPGGSLWLEHGYDQGAAVRALLETSRYQKIVQHPDLAGILRVSGGYA